MINKKISLLFSIFFFIFIKISLIYLPFFIFQPPLAFSQAGPERLPQSMPKRKLNLGSSFSQFLKIPIPQHLFHSVRSPERQFLNCQQGLDQEVFFQEHLVRVVSDRTFMEELNPQLRRGEDELSLEIGASKDPLCSNCIFLDVFKSGLELTKESVMKSGKGFEGLLADARSIPFRGNTIDKVVIKNFIFPDKENLKKVLQEQYRILRNKGKLYFLTSNFDVEQNLLPENVLGMDTLQNFFSLPYQVAKEIGLKITPIITEKNVGLILEKGQ